MKALFIGRTTIDLIFKLENLPLSDTKVKAKDFVRAGGGPALNASIIFSKLNNGNCDLFTIIGNSSLTNIVKEDLRKHNVNVYDFNEEEAELATSSIFIEPNGNRTVVGSPLKKLSVNKKTKIDWNKNYDIVLWDGYYPEIFQLYLKNKKNDPIIVLDADRYQPHVEKYFKNIDILIAGDTFGIPNKNLKKELPKVFNKFAITNGSSEIYSFDNLKEKLIPVTKINPVDTLGAGDFFHGSFCYYYLKSNKNFIKALKEASKIAGESCKHFGSREWLKLINN